MDRNDIGRLLIEARRVVGEDDFVIVGSMSILGKTATPPASMTGSTDVDLFPRDKPDLAFRLETDLGMGSSFHKRQHYYADPVSPWLSTMPHGWQYRMTMVDVAPNLRAWFVDPDDAAISKYARGQKRDRAWVRTGLEAGLISLATIERRLEDTVMEPDERHRVVQSIVEDRIWLQNVDMALARSAPAQSPFPDDSAGRQHFKEMARASEQFKELVGAGQLQKANFYLTEYKRAVDRAAAAALDGNQFLISASRRHYDLQTTMESLQRRRDIVAKSTRYHLNLNQHEGDTNGSAPSSPHGKERRKILEGKLDALALFEDLYDGVTRTAQNVPIGALHRHAEERLRQSYAVLVLVEQARDAGIVAGGSRFVPTGARVQDKTTSKEYPAAHRLPADVSIRGKDGKMTRLSDFFDLPVDRLWVDKHVFAPTDRVHRLANVADRWCEEAGMVSTLASAATAIARREMTAEEAMTRIVQPGYRDAIHKSLDKIERNFSYLERQELARRVVDVNGQPYDRLPMPLVLHVQGLAERATAKDLMERTLRAYSAVTDLSPELRMQTAITVSAIVENEQRMARFPIAADRNEKEGDRRFEVDALLQHSAAP